MPILTMHIIGKSKCSRGAIQDHHGPLVFFGIYRTRTSGVGGSAELRITLLPPTDRLFQNEFPIAALLRTRTMTNIVRRG